MNSPFLETAIFENEFSDSFSSFENLSSSPLSEKENIFSSHDSTNKCDSSSISSGSKKIRKKRTAYQKIDDNLRLELLDAIQRRGESLKIASRRLNINYSSAKSILHTYRKEGRILKKTAFERSMSLWPVTALNQESKKNGTLECSKFQFLSQSYEKSPLDFFHPSRDSVNISQKVHEKIDFFLNASSNNLQEINQISQQHQHFQNHYSSPVIKNFHYASGTPTTTTTSDSQTIQTSPFLSLKSPLMIPLEEQPEPTQDHFYMNYSNSPLSEGVTEVCNDNSNPKSRNYFQQEFDSFTEMINTFQNQTAMNEEFPNELFI